MAGAAEILDLEGLERWAGSVGQSLSSPDYRKPLEISKRLIAEATKENFQGQHTPDGVGWPPIQSRPDGKSHALWDTGRLVASTGAGQGHVEQISRNELVYGTNVQYAAIHQYGGVINAQPGKALAIPLSSEAKKAGSPRSFGGVLAMVKRPGHPPLLVENVSQGRQRSKFHYVLVRSVTIPRRTFLGISDKLANQIAQVFADFTEEQIRKS